MNKDKLELINNFISSVSFVKDKNVLKDLTAQYEKKLFDGDCDEELDRMWQGLMKLADEVVVHRVDQYTNDKSRHLAELTDEERSELKRVEKILDGNLFEYYFQPIVSTADGEIFSYEALMRAKHDPAITPYHILKYARILGRLNDIERATFLNILTIIDSDDDVVDGRRVFINSIPSAKLSPEDYRKVGELLVKHCDRAVIEMTEQAEPDEVSLNELKEYYARINVKIAIDDYGTGYSNVTNLLRYMPNFVKIDRTLISEIQSSSTKKHFVREIVEFCHDNNILALAEGVETSEELRSVILLGVDLVQGYYTARPSPQVIKSIDEDKKLEIRRYKHELLDGKAKQIYKPHAKEHVKLERLVKEGYKCIFLGKNAGAVTISGMPTMDTDVHIEVDNEFKGSFTLDNAHFGNEKNKPCIQLGENSEVLIMIHGNIQLEKGGICIPESTKVEFQGIGEMIINLDYPDYFAIGNDKWSRHGPIVFNANCDFRIHAVGDSGICIGSGLGGKIEILRGMYGFHIDGGGGVCIGSLDSNTELDIKNCAIESKHSSRRGLVIGSLRNTASISISGISLRSFMSVKEAVVLGTLEGGLGDISIQNSNIFMDLNADKMTVFGAFKGNSKVKIDQISCMIRTHGHDLLVFGGRGDINTVSIDSADLDLEIYTDNNRLTNARAENIKLGSGARNINLNGEKTGFVGLE